MNGPTNPPDPYPGHEGGAWAPVPCDVVASWPRGHFAENVAVDPDGTVYVTLYSHQRIDRFDPRTRQVDAFARLPFGPAGLAFDAAGTLWVTGGVVGQTPGHVWRIRDGEAEPWVEIADAVFMNGCTPHPDGRTLLVCESVTGRILAIDQTDKRWQVWLQDGRLLPKSSDMPGANGIKLRDGWAWISNTAHDRMLRSRIAADGSAGALEVVADNLHGDDFAFAESGAAYIVTHAAHSVVRLGSNGERKTIAGPDQGAVGGTACAFGRGAQDRQSLYVTTTGGLRFPYRGEIRDAKLLRLDVGERGQSLLPGQS